MSKLRKIREEDDSMKTTITVKNKDATMRGAAAIAHILQKEGIEVLTCFPHNEIIDTVADLGTRPIMCRTERMAIHIADGYARLNNGQKIAAVCVQDGPGIENAFGPDGRRDGPVADEIAAVKAEFLAEWMPRLTSDDNPISPYRVIWEVMQNFDRTRTSVTHDAGSPRDQAVATYESLVPHGYIGWGKTTQLGTSLGLAVGAKLAKPDWYAVNIMGDGAFGMIGMDFETAVRNQIPICTIVLNNGVLGGYDGYLPISTEKFGTRNLTGRYAALAQALGGYGERIEQAAELAPAMQRAQQEMDNGRAVLLEVMIREESVFAKY
jgi:thiamine pyrophosphate-dependent acetolactate synthase large subunit-like protein